MVDIFGGFLLKISNIEKHDCNKHSYKKYMLTVKSVSFPLILICKNLSELMDFLMNQNCSAIVLCCKLDLQFISFNFNFMARFEFELTEFICLDR